MTLLEQAKVILEHGGQEMLNLWVKNLTADQQNRLAIETFEAAIRLDERTKAEQGNNHN